MSVAELLPWLQVLNILLLPVVVGLIRIERRLTIVEQFAKMIEALEKRIARLEDHVYERRRT